MLLAMVASRAAAECLPLRLPMPSCGRDPNDSDAGSSRSAQSFGGGDDPRRVDCRRLVAVSFRENEPLVVRLG